MKFLIEPFLTLYKNRRVLLATTMVDIKSRYAGSVMGLIWMVLYPILFLAAYSFVYVFILKVQVSDMTPVEYIILIFSGLVPFLGFSEGLAVSTSAITSNASLVKNTLFPIAVIPVKAVLSTQSIEVVGMILLLVASAATGRLSVYTLLLFPVWVLQLLFGAGVGWIVASINVLAKDLQSMIGLISLFIMMISPIAYRADSVDGVLAVFLKLNPLYYFITVYQNCFLFAQLPPTSVLVIMVAFSIGIFCLGYAFFQKMSQLFADNI